jgi:hypothetical protein
MEIRERPPSTLRNVDGAPPPYEVLLENLLALTITTRNGDGGPPGPRGGSGPHSGSEGYAVTCIGMIDKK